jgi:putative flippase GtrA
VAESVAWPARSLIESKKFSGKITAVSMCRLLSISTKSKFLTQFFRYAIIGASTNGIGFLLYLLITSYGGSPKLTVTALYAMGSLINFLANRRFTFRHGGHAGRAGVRYLGAQLAGYLMNLLILMLFVDWLGYSHQYVQAAAIFVVAVFLFLLSRYFVFTPERARRVDHL